MKLTGEEVSRSRVVMPRAARAAEGSLIYHVLNRGNGRMRLFHKPGDYEAE